MHSDLINIVHNLVLEESVPAKELAKEIGKPYSTLLREVNPYDEGAKLGVDTMLNIMKYTRNVEPLKYMAAELGYSLVRAADDGGMSALSGDRKANDKTM